MGCAVDDGLETRYWDGEDVDWLGLHWDYYGHRHVGHTYRCHVHGTRPRSKRHVGFEKRCIELKREARKYSRAHESAKRTFSNFPFPSS